jgi:CheY-like chemotaxis protein
MSLSLRIAVIDDDEEMRLALDDLLSSFSHLVRCYADGNVFLDALEEFQPDMIVTDYQMPGLTGLEIIKTLRATGVPTPAVLITAFASEPMRKAAIEAGCLALLKKPFEPSDLISLLDETIGK